MARDDEGGLQALMGWCAQEGLVADDLAALLGGFCDRLCNLGIPLHRGHISLPTRSPLFSGVGATWSRDGETETGRFGHGGFDREPFRSSPFRHMIDNRLPSLRRRLAAGGDPLDFPMLADLRASGATDYVCRLHYFSRDFRGMGRTAGLEGATTSWTTDRASGFDDDDIARIDRVLPSFVLAALRVVMHQAMSDLLDAYVGPDAGRRVMMGQTNRGQVEERLAALLLMDLRGFTALADVTAGADIVALLDAVFEAVAEPIDAAGGTILKFLGDGLLAMFTVDGGDEAPVCRRALGAAEAALAAIEVLGVDRRALGKPSLPMDAALHFGKVMYGNVGSSKRIDFTTIGPAVNEASRIEALCETLGRSLLISPSFAAAHGGRMVSLGHHRLRGVSAAQEIFALG